MEQANNVPMSMRFPFFTKMMYFTVTRYLLELHKAVVWAAGRAEPRPPAPAPAPWCAGLHAEELASLKSICQWCKQQERRAAGDKGASHGAALRPDFVTEPGDFLAFALEAFTLASDAYRRTGPEGLGSGASAWKKKGSGRIRQGLLSLEQLPGVCLERLRAAFPELENSSDSEDDANGEDWLERLQARPDWPMLEKEAKCRVAREIQAVRSSSEDQTGTPAGAAATAPAAAPGGTASAAGGSDDAEQNELLAVFEQDHSRLHVPLSDELGAGERVEAKFRKSVKYFRGTVEGVGRASGKESAYAITFDDGDYDAGVRRRHIRGLPCDAEWKRERKELHLQQLVQQERADKARAAAASSGRGGGGGGRKRRAGAAAAALAPTPTKEKPGVKRRRCLQALERFIQDKLATVDFQPPPSPPSPPPPEPEPELTPEERAAAEHQARLGQAFLANFVAFYSVFSKHEEAVAQQQQQQHLEQEAVQRRARQERAERAAHRRATTGATAALAAADVVAAAPAPAPAPYTNDCAGGLAPLVPEVPEVPMVPMMPDQPEESAAGQHDKQEMHTVMI